MQKTLGLKFRGKFTIPAIQICLFIVPPILCVSLLILLPAGCSKQPKSLEESAPDAVYDTRAQSKVFPVVATGYQPMIDDLEDGDLKGLKADGRNWNWEQFDDASDGVQFMTVQKVEDAPGKGKNVLYLKGGNWKYKGAGIRAQLVSRTPPQPFGYYDASVYAGIQFWIKAIGLYRGKLAVSAPENSTSDEGGYCIENCADHVEFTFPLTPEWQLISIPFDAFVLPSSNTAGLLDPSRMKGIHLWAETSGDYEVWLDDLALITQPKE